MRSRLSASLLAALLLVAPRVAFAKQPGDLEASLPMTDTTYGRLEGDVGVVLGAGVTLGPRAPRATVDLRLRYLDSVGLFATYEDGPLGGATTTDPVRVLALGTEIRPFFLARWVTGREAARGFTDLLVDSFGLELGVVFAQPTDGAFGDRAGLQASLGLELPFFARASGLWLGLHGGIRWSDAALSGAAVVTPSDRSGFLSLTLAWHQLFVTHMVDVGDRGPR